MLPVGKGAISVAFVRPSVCPSVAYIANIREPKFGRKVPHLRYDSHTSFKVKRSKVKVTSGPLMLTHILRHIFWMRTYRIPLVVVVGVTLGVFLGHFRINLHQTHTHYSNEGSQHCNWAQFSKSRILSPKNSYLSISASKYVMGRTETNTPRHFIT